MRKQKERNSIVIIVAYVVLGIISFMCIAPVVLMAVSFTNLRAHETMENLV